MQNKYFKITFDDKTGGIESVINPTDEHQMNWCDKD